MKTVNKGFTLLELLVTISILAILATMAMPSYRNFMENQKIRSVVNEWQSAYHFAQHEAMRLKQVVTFCGSKNGQTCNEDGANIFSYGWIIYYGSDEANNKVILQDKAFENDRVNASVSGLGFKKEGFKFLANGRIQSSTIGTLTVEMKESTNSNKKEIRVNAGGRLSPKS